MIDWLNVIYHLLWVFGAAIILSVFSYADWQATQQGLKLRNLLQAVPYQRLILLGCILISLSLFMLAERWWQQILWGVFFGLFGLQIWLLRS